MTTKAIIILSFLAGGLVTCLALIYNQAPPTASTDPKVVRLQNCKSLEVLIGTDKIYVCNEMEKFYADLGSHAGYLKGHDEGFTQGYEEGPDDGYASGQQDCNQ